MTKLKIASAVILAAIALATAGVVAVGGPAARRAQARDAGMPASPGRRRANRPAMRCQPPEPSRIRPGDRGPDRRPGGPARRRRPGRGHEPLVGPGQRPRPVARPCPGPRRPYPSEGLSPGECLPALRVSPPEPLPVTGEPGGHHRRRRPLPPGRRRPGAARRDPRHRADDRHDPALRHGSRRCRGPRDGPPGADAQPRSSSTPGGSITPPRPASRSRGWSATRTRAGPSPGSPSAPRSTRSTASSRPRASRRRPTTRGVIASPDCPGRRPIASSSSRARAGLIPRRPSAPRATPGVRAGDLRHRAEAGHPGPGQGDRQGDRPAGSAAVDVYAFADNPHVREFPGFRREPAGPLLRQGRPIRGRRPAGPRHHRRPGRRILRIAIGDPSAPRRSRGTIPG